MTATVETVAEQLDLAAIMPAEKVVTAVARSVTLSETDVGKLYNNYRIHFMHFSNSFLFLIILFSHSNCSSSQTSID